MERFSEKEMEFSLLQDKPIDFTGIVMKYLFHWKWFVTSIIVTFLIATTYIIYSTPSYKVQTSILFKDDSRGGVSELNVLKEMGLITRRSNVDNEIEVLSKSLIAQQVVQELNIYTTYLEKKEIGIFKKLGVSKSLPSFITKKKRQIYKDESPFMIIIGDSIMNKMTKPIKIEVLSTTNGDLTFKGSYNDLEYKVRISKSDSIVTLPFGNVSVMRSFNQSDKEDRTIYLVINNNTDISNQYLGSLKIDLTSKTSSVANITLVCRNIALGIEFLDSYIKTYNQQGINEQIELADKTSKVIEEHLSQLSGELSSVETVAQDYRQSKGLTNIASQADIYSSQSANVRQRLVDIESQLEIANGLNNFVQNLSDHTQMIPSAGITSVSLISQIEEYNKLVLERNRLSRIASNSNQSMIDLNNRIETTFSTVRKGVQNEKRNLEIQQNDISSMLSQNYARIRAIPQQEREYSDILRQQNVKEALFVYLLQKKEEKYMNMASVMPNSRLIDNIYVKGIASPNKIMILIIALVVGLLTPIFIILIKNLLHFQVTTKDDLKEISSIPILAEIPLLDKGSSIGVEEDNTDSFNEMIRLLRANLLFVINGSENKVINMLSSVSGEGKTFLVINLAKSLALLDKKVVIVELDIRRPKISKTLGVNNKIGISLYLGGSLKKESLVKPSNLHKNLDIITSGPIPPNPNELLAKSRLDELIYSLREEYDYIIIDTAPIAVVSDSFLLNRLTDVNLYVVKSGSTHKKLIEDADSYFQDGKLKKMYFVLNGVDLSKQAYAYGYKLKYGYK